MSPPISLRSTGDRNGPNRLRHVTGLQTGNPANGGFQLYTIAHACQTVRIPSFLSFEKGAVLPLSISTAAIGLYLPEYLGLSPLPSLTAQTSDSSSSEIKKTLLVWGGSSSVGSTTIQLATASGLRVVTTASRANFDYVRSLGAAAVFDYRSPTVVEDLVNEIKGPARELVGVYDAIGEAETSVAHLARVLDALGGDAKARFEVASVLPSDGNPYGLRSKFSMFPVPVPVPGSWILGPAFIQKVNEANKQSGAWHLLSPKIATPARLSGRISLSRLWLGCSYRRNRILSLWDGD